MCLLVSNSGQAQFIHSDPPAVDGVVSICAGDSVVFQAAALESTKFSWEFSEGAESASAAGEGPFSVQFPSEGGPFEVILNGYEDDTGFLVFSDTLEVVNFEVFNSDLSLVSPGVNFISYVENDSTYFALCNSPVAQVFQFASTYGADVSQSFDWGDGSLVQTEQDLVGSVISHAYEQGEYILTHTVTSPSGCLLRTQLSCA